MCSGDVSRGGVVNAEVFEVVLVVFDCPRRRRTSSSSSRLRTSRLAR